MMIYRTFSNGDLYHFAGFTLQGAVRVTTGELKNITTTECHRGCFGKITKFHQSTYTIMVIHKKLFKTSTFKKITKLILKFDFA